jgi:hypothetical protein
LKISLDIEVIYVYNITLITGKLSVMLYKFKNLEDYPLKELLEEYAEDGKITSGKMLPQFFAHALAYISRTVILIDNEGVEISRDLSRRDQLRAISSTNTITKMLDNKLAMLLLKVFYAIPRSQILNLSQTHKDARQYSSAVPLFMSAFKLFDGIDYEWWDKSDPKLKYFLGNSLEGLLALGDWDFEYDQDKRDTALTVMSTGEVQPPTSYKCLKAAWQPDVGRRDIIARMVLQTWVFNTVFRNDLMILDPWNWESMPKSLDITGEDILMTKGSKAKTKAVDDVFAGLYS